jgi:hypothetical protein
MKGFALIAAIVITSAPAYGQVRPVPPSPSGGSSIRAYGGVDLGRLRLQRLIRAGEDPCWKATPAPTPTPSFNWPDQTPALSTQWKPCFPAQGGLTVDPQIAVSQTRVVVTSQRRMGFYEKSGSYLGSITARQMFSALGLDDGTVDAVNDYRDLRAVYDSHRNRFWLSATGLTRNQPDPAKRRSIIAVAVSKSNSPLDGWYLYWWDAVNDFGNTGGSVYQAGDLAEDPFIGIDADAIHQANGVFNAGNHRYWRIAFFPATPMANGVAGPLAGWQYGDLQNPNGGAAWMVQPVVHHGSSTRAYYASRQGQGQAVVWAITNVLQPGQQIARTAVAMTPWNKPVNAPQKNSPDLIRMNRLGTAVLKATYRDGWLHLVTNDAQNWFGDGMLSSLRLVRLDVSGFPFIPTSGGFIDRRFGKNHPNEDPPDAHVHYAWPAVAVNKDGNMVVVYSRSGSTLFPEARFSAYMNGDADILSSRRLREGEGPYDIPGWINPVLPWGETAGASVDPFDDVAVWMAHQYSSHSGGALGNHDIWVGKVFGEQTADVTLFAAIRESGPPLVGGGGMPADILYRMRNEGDGLFEAVTVQIFIVGEDGRRVLVSTTQQRGLAPGEQRRVIETIVIPRETAPGSYQVLIVADPDNRIAEYSETNNTANFPLLVTER